MQDKWIEIRVELNPKHLEKLSSYLFALGAEGITERETAFVVYFPSDEWTAEKWQMLQTLCREVDEQVTFSSGEVEAQNWNENWKQNFKPLVVSEHCVVVPEWDADFPANGRHKIIISPKMAFGTGHHESTQLILSLLPGYVQSGTRVLDAGTGSGILAIHAIQLGAASVFAFDTDPVAVENADENIALNHCANVIETKIGVLNDAPEGPFGLLLANINRNVLLALPQNLLARAETGATLILSGLLESDTALVRQTYEAAGWQYREARQLGEWMALVFVK
jgi:ribosomal protein L11 methyltransferase